MCGCQEVGLVDAKIFILEKAVLREKCSLQQLVIWYLNFLLANRSLHVFEAYGN